MRWQTGKFIDDFFEKNGKDFRDVLEVGSRDINGNIRERFAGMRFIGTDMINGPNVDVVVNGHFLLNHFKDKQFDIVCCFDTLEHDDRFWLTVIEMSKVLKPGGWMLIGVPSRNCNVHDWPDDYWRFMESGVKEMFTGFEEVNIEVERSKQAPDIEDEIYGWGRKPNNI